MALPLADLITMRDELLRNRAKGIRMAQLNGERVEFKTDAEMASALGDLEARIARASGPRQNVVRFSTSKGF